MRRERPNAIGIDADSGPGQYGAVCKDLRGSVYPHPRMGHKGASLGRLWGAGWRDPARARSGLLLVRAGKFSFSAVQNTKEHTKGPM